MIFSSGSFFLNPFFSLNRLTSEKAKRSSDSNPRGPGSRWRSKRLDISEAGQRSDRIMAHNIKKLDTTLGDLIAAASEVAFEYSDNDKEAYRLARLALIEILRNASYSMNVEENFNGPRSEEHTSELQSHSDLVCRLLL